MPMADPVYPNRPSTASDPLQPRALADRELPEHGTPSELGHIPEERESNPRLNSAAENVGRALGNAVSGVRSIPERVSEQKQRFTVIRGRGSESAKEKVEDAVEQAREKGEELVEKAREKSEELTSQAKVRLQQTRLRIERLAHGDPLRIIGAAAVMGVVLGIMLRLWRDHAS